MNWWRKLRQCDKVESLQSRASELERLLDMANVENTDLVRRLESARTEAQKTLSQSQFLMRFITARHKPDHPTEEPAPKAPYIPKMSGKGFAILTMLMVALSVSGQPMFRNFFTTNQAPVVDVVAGSGISVVPSLVGTDTRRFTVSATGAVLSSDLWGTNNNTLTNIYGNVLFSDRRVVSGSSNVVGSTVTNSFVIGGNSNNVVSPANDSGIVGGQLNTVSRVQAGEYPNIGTVIVGGVSNVLEGTASSTLGGEFNAITSAKNSIIAGGWFNRILSEYDHSAILAGELNTLDNGADWSAIIAGYNNYVNSSSTGLLLGGQNNAMKDAFGSVVSGGDHHGITNAFYASIVGGQRSGILNGDGSVIVGGFSNRVNVFHSSFGIVIGSSISNSSNNSIEIGVGDLNKTRFDSTGVTMIGGTMNTTNDLNTALVGRINTATNDVATRTTSSTNDLSGVLKGYADSKTNSDYLIPVVTNNLPPVLTNAISQASYTPYQITPTSTSGGPATNVLVDPANGNYQYVVSGTNYYISCQSPVSAQASIVRLDLWLSNTCVVSFNPSFLLSNAAPGNFTFSTSNINVLLFDHPYPSGKGTNYWRVFQL